MTIFLRTCLCFLAIWSTAVFAAERPNIVLIIADDLGFSDLGCYGGEIRTPNLDRMAKAGLRFTQFYNCGSGELTRATLYSGLHPRLGPAGSTKGILRPDMVTPAEVLRQAGYATILTGKWQLGEKAPARAIDRGFEEFYGVLGSRSHYFNPAKADPNPNYRSRVFTEGDANRIFAHNETVITGFPADYYATDAFSDHAIKTIRRKVAEGRPFFLNLAYTAPHYPIQAPSGDIARYRGKYADGYDPLREHRFQRQQELGLFQTGAVRLSSASLDHLYDHEFEPWKRLNDSSRQRHETRMEAYAAMVDRLDQGVGRVLTALEETGAARNTVVIFLSDNGGNNHFPWRSVNVTPRQELVPVFAFNAGIPVGDPRGFEFLGPGWGWAVNAPFRGYKYLTYEGGICTPLIVRWPGKAPAGKVTGEPGHVVDLMPTLLELAGAKYPERFNGQATLPLEGESLVPVLHDGKLKPRRLPLGWELFGSRALRDGEWKLVWKAGLREWELYNLDSDRSETVDLAAKHPERLKSMVAKWEEWARQTDAPIR